MCIRKNDLRQIVCSVVCLTFAVFINGSVASNWSIPVGFVLEHNFYNQFGLTASVANNKLLNGHPQATISATTSRLQVVSGYNVLKKENYLLTLAWHLRPATHIDPFAGIDIGLTHFSLEDDELFERLKNNAMLFNIRIGATTTLLDGRLRPVVDGGLAMISSSTVFPLFWSVKICYDVTKWGGK